MPLLNRTQPRASRHYEILSFIQNLVGWNSSFQFDRTRFKRKVPITRSVYRFV